jgi:hypothetical protein
MLSTKYRIETKELKKSISPKEALNKLIPFMVRQAHHERNQPLTVRPEPVEGLIQRFPKQRATLK